MLPANTTANSTGNPLVKLSTGSNSTMELSSALPDFANSFRPRAHSLEGISRAKIKSVKQTIVVITSYVIFSAPAVIVQLWRAWIQGQNQLGKAHKPKKKCHYTQALEVFDDFYVIVH